MKKIIVANWKLNPETPREVGEIAMPVKRAAAKLRNVLTIICPPAIFLQLLSSRPAKNLAFGGQDAFGDTLGAYTGKIGPTMLKHAGATYVILGHSEMRASSDTDVVINHKVRLALRSGLKVILCVGEHERDHEGKYLAFIKAQLETDLKNVQRRDYGNLIIAYEPIWAIGATAQVADTPEAFRHEAIHIRKVLAGLVGKEAAMRVPVLYGGSVNAKNAEGFLRDGHADGLLVGRESLRPDKFIQILKIADTVK